MDLEIRTNASCFSYISVKNHKRNKENKMKIEGAIIMHCLLPPPFSSLSFRVFTDNIKNAIMVMYSLRRGPE